MADRLTYAGWASMTLRDKGLDGDQKARADYFSNSGKVQHYDEYKAFCQQEKKSYDNPPDGYWESLEKPWHKPTGVAMVLTGILMWFISGVIGGTTGQRRY